METKALLQRWNAGDSSALEELLERELPILRERVHRRLGAMLRRKDETGDVVQDAAVQFLRYGPRFVVNDDEQLRALLFRIVENVIRDRNDWYTARRRSLSRERPLPTDTVLTLDPPERAVTTPSQVALRNEREAWVRLALELLEPDDRNVIVLRMWDDLAFVEIGRKLELAEDAARMRFNRAVGRLSEKVTALRQGELLQAIGETPPSADQ